MLIFFITQEMERKLTIHIIFWLMLSNLVLATDHYVRPAGGTYGDEDGSSYTDAWDGLLNVAWGASAGEVGPGDTLYVCGLNYHTVENVQNIATQGDITPVSGSSGSRIIIRGDYSGDPGIVWGAALLSHTSWTDEGNGVWSITLPGSLYAGNYFADVTATSYTLLTPVASEAACDSTVNSHYSSDYATNSKLFIHLQNELIPTGRVWANRIGYDWQLDGLSYITFMNLKFYCPYRFFETTESADYITWQGCTLWYGEDQLLPFYNGSDNCQVINCDIAWAKNGIYNISNTATGAPSNYIYRGNFIHDIGYRTLDQNTDAHPIGIQGGDGGLIEHNYCVNCGSGILFHAYELQECTNNIIRRNVIINPHVLGGCTGWGIGSICDTDASADKTGNEYYQNIVVGATVGGRFNFEAENPCYNNVFYNCTKGFDSVRNKDLVGAVVEIKNNLFLSNTYHIYWTSGATTYTIDSDYNSFYPTAGDLFHIDGVDKNLAQWKAFEHSGSTFDPHSQTSDPKVIDATVHNFFPQSDSPLIDNGIDVGLTTDKHETPIPQGEGIDIGCFEWGTGIWVVF
jgi:hypothetical protein